MVIASRPSPSDRGVTAGANPSVTLIVVCVGYFLVLLDVTMVNVALPDMRADLAAGVDALQWVVDAYALALAGLMLGAGTFGDLHGHRRVALSGLALFAAGSLACGLAPGVGALIAARVLQGVGAALLLPATLAIIANLYPDRSARARAIGVWAAVGSIALPAGPLIGGVLVEALGWRSVFLLNLPVIGVAGPLAAVVLRPDRGTDRGALDLAGVGLGAAALCSLTFASIEAGRAGLSAPVVAAAVIGLGFGALFIATELRVSRPILPPALLRRPRFAVANAVAASMNLGTLGTLFVLTLYLQSVRGNSARVAGLAMLPLFAPLTVLAPYAGRLVGKVGPRRPMILGLALASAGLLGIATLGADSAYPHELVAMLLWGVGLAS